ncbi:MAG TPA: isoprenylcysteine carboxylmethyltransferase family protein [Opitutaceae bacterium]|nr:isoprenylcysteine carboxylmethyltransferase family protein [Opitutaceae bacterium]
MKSTELTFSDSPREPSWPMRAWRALPESTFNAIGFLFFAALLVRRIPAYRAFPEMPPYYRFADGRMLYMPFIHILADATSLLLMLGFILRQSSRTRNARGRDVLLALSGALWPFLPFFVGFVLQASDAWFGTHALAPYRSFSWSSSLPLARTVAGIVLITLGDAGDIWSYGVLLRSFSIVPEARALCVTGPYRLIRHPVYFSQMLAQAGVFLCFAVPNGVWLAFWLVFCVLQLLRARREEQVLEAAFGREYLAWKDRTFWLW